MDTVFSILMKTKCTVFAGDADGYVAYNASPFMFYKCHIQGIGPRCMLSALTCINNLQYAYYTNMCLNVDLTISDLEVHCESLSVPFSASDQQFDQSDIVSVGLAPSLCLNVSFSLIWSPVNAHESEGCIIYQYYKHIHVQVLKAVVCQNYFKVHVKE